MKRILMTFSFLMLLTSFAHAVEVESVGSVERQLQRAGSNIALAPLEVVHALSDHADDPERFPPGYIYAFGKGFFLAVERAAVGVYELLAIPFQRGKGADPVIQPEFVWEHFSK